MSGVASQDLVRPRSSVIRGADNHRRHLPAFRAAERFELYDDRFPPYLRHLQVEQDDGVMIAAKRGQRDIPATRLNRTLP